MDSPRAFNNAHAQYISLCTHAHTYMYVCVRAERKGGKERGRKGGKVGRREARREEMYIQTMRVGHIIIGTSLVPRHWSGKSTTPRN